MTNFLFSKSLEGKLTEASLLVSDHKKMHDIIAIINGKQFDVISIEVKNDQVYLTIASKLVTSLLKKNIDIDYLIICGETLMFNTPMVGKFTKSEAKDNINFNTCTIVISECMFWSRIENV